MNAMLEDGGRVEVAIRNVACGYVRMNVGGIILMYVVPMYVCTSPGDAGATCLVVGCWQV